MGGNILKQVREPPRLELRTFPRLNVRKALILSNSAGETDNPHYKAIYLSTHGIMFLGTPHLGLDGTEALQLIPPQILSTNLAINSQLIGELHIDSRTLSAQLRLYNPISSDFKTIFFYQALVVNADEIVPLPH